ncbi:MAG TPA: ClpXP protease specificity-enhancing factor SspB [Alphaproteobacteria bacterium]
MAPKKEDEILRYDRMVERALRGVVRDAVNEVIADGLSGDHHFYITFLTDHPGVKIPDYLRERYPGEMTIVLQYQFYDLEVDEKMMAVTLSFNNVPERLEIPLPAITIFADPSVNFALQFQPLEGPEEGPEDGGKKGKKKSKDKGEAEAAPAAKKTGEVVSLDQFRKKD